jgi:hypothetical protein
MARGWESKDVEGQQELFQTGRSAAAKAALTAVQLARLHEIECLRLSRTRVLHELEETRVPRRREILMASLAHLEARLRGLLEPGRAGEI